MYFSSFPYRYFIWLDFPGKSKSVVVRIKTKPLTCILCSVMVVSHHAHLVSSCRFFFFDELIHNKTLCGASAMTTPICSGWGLKIKWEQEALCLTNYWAEFGRSSVSNILPCFDIHYGIHCHHYGYAMTCEIEYIARLHIIGF